MYRVATGSMHPGLPVGSELIVHKTHTDFKKGDVITFHMTPDQIVSHRFIGVYKKTGGLMTKGDANLTPDVHFTPLRRSDVVGRVVLHSNILTWAFWKTAKAMIALVAIGLLAWVLFSETEAAPTAEKNNEKESEKTDQLAGSNPV